MRPRTSPLARAVAGGAIALAATLTLSVVPHQQASAATLVPSPSTSPAALSFSADHDDSVIPASDAHPALSAAEKKATVVAKAKAKVKAVPASAHKATAVKIFTPDPVVKKKPARVVTHTATKAATKTSASASAGPAVSYSGSNPRAIAQGMLSSFGWSSSQMSCLSSLWNRESGWNVHAANASGAYGIPQALPGSKMSSAGSDWANNPTTQIRWGLGYIKSTYGSPCAAWGHSQSNGWY